MEHRVQALILAEGWYANTRFVVLNSFICCFHKQRDKQVPIGEALIRGREGVRTFCTPLYGILKHLESSNRLPYLCELIIGCCLTHAASLQLSPALSAPLSRTVFSRQASLLLYNDIIN